MANLILIKVAFVLAIVLTALSAVRIVHLFRARAMRAFAAKWGFQYVGPAAPPTWWWNPPHLKIHPPVPAWVSHFYPCGQRIRQVWNVIEGTKNGVSIVIFDSVIGEFRGGRPCTVIACQTTHNPPAITSMDRMAQTDGWTVIHGAWFLWFSWMMGIKRLNGHLSKLAPGHQH